MKLNLAGKLLDIGFPDVPFGNVAVLVEQEAGWRCHDAAKAFCDLAVGIVRELERQVVPLDVVGHVLKGIIGHGNRDGLVPLLAEGPLHGGELGHFRDATRTAGGPKVDEHHFAAQLGQGSLLAIQRGERDIRCPLVSGTAGQDDQCQRYQQVSKREPTNVFHAFILSERMLVTREGPRVTCSTTDVKTEI